MNCQESKQVYSATLLLNAQPPDYQSGALTGPLALQAPTPSAQKLWRSDYYFKFWHHKIATASQNWVISDNGSIVVMGNNGSIITAVKCKNGSIITAIVCNDDVIADDKM